MFAERFRIGGQRDGSVFCRRAVFIDDAGGEIPAFYRFHHGGKGVPERFLVGVGARGGRLLCVAARPVADLVGDGGGQAGKGRVKRFIAIRRFGKDLIHEKLTAGGQRIKFFLRVRDEPGLAGKHLAHGADKPGNVLDAIQDHVVFVAENDVAVLAHDFDDELFSAQVAQLIQMLHRKDHDALQPRLGNGNDPAVLDMLS